MISPDFIDGQTAARSEYGLSAVAIICKCVGSFANDPADSEFTRGYLYELARLITIALKFN